MVNGKQGSSLVGKKLQKEPLKTLKKEELVFLITPSQ